MNPQWLEHDARVKPYVRRKRIAAFSRQLFFLTALGIAVQAQVFSHLERALALNLQSHRLLWFSFFAIIGLASFVLGIPFAIWGQKIERDFQLSRQSWSSWFQDLGKGLLVGAVIGAVFLGALHAAQELFPTRWWLVFWFFTILLSLVLARLAPVVLIPLFFKLKPLEEGSLRQRLLGLGDRFGIRTAEIFHLGMGEKTEKGNAAYVGLGKTKRILLGDTLYLKFPEDQVEAVFAHELGHQVHEDLWRGLALGAGLSLLSFFLAHQGLLQFLSWSGRNVSQPVSVLVFFLLVGFFQTLLGPIQTAFSRAWERQADSFAAKEFQMGLALAEALEKLTVQNFGEFRPNRFFEVLFHTHPAPSRRIMALRPSGG